MTDLSPWAAIQRLEVRVENLEGELRRLREVRPLEPPNPEIEAKLEQERAEYIEKVFAQFPKNPETGDPEVPEESWMTDGVGIVFPK